VDGKLVEIPRGGLVASVRYLSGRWKWSNTKVCSFLEILKSEGMIKTEKRHGNTVLMLCNYETYNALQDTKKTDKRRLDDAQTTLERQPIYKEEGEEHKEIVHTQREAVANVDDVISEGSRLIPPCPEEMARKWYEEKEGVGWVDRNNIPIRKWKPLLSSWWRGCQETDRRQAALKPKFNGNQRGAADEALHKQKHEKYGW
jgi:hypothetical protein